MDSVVVVDVFIAFSVVVFVVVVLALMIVASHAVFSCVRHPKVTIKFFLVVGWACKGIFLSHSTTVVVELGVSIKRELHSKVSL